MCAWENSLKMGEEVKIHKNLHLESCASVLVSHITSSKLKLVCIETLSLYRQCIMAVCALDRKCGLEITKSDDQHVHLHI